MACAACYHGKARHGKASSPLNCYCCIVGVYDFGAKKKSEEPKLADENKVVVEVIKQEAPVTEPTFEWWICWRDKKDDKDFRCLTVDTPEQVSREVDRLGGELAGRCIWVTMLAGSYKSEIMVKVLPHLSTTEMARRCVN